MCALSDILFGFETVGPRVLGSGARRGVPVVYGAGAPNALIQLTVFGRGHGALSDERGNWCVSLMGVPPGTYRAQMVQTGEHDMRTGEQQIDVPEPLHY